ncbi:hypothetical protein BCR39DRAFT_562206 [Naematelia encephala]|uniref:Uncharacterized protein n=1 Tax=Naematelia encephala TaxID=71784 RepID=A0A1Y2AJK3_9TREE|nr:hypothetical protein BCR39DRAFT_562206 [Naematelia encephala]
MAPLPIPKIYPVPRRLIIKAFDSGFDGSAQPPPPTFSKSNLPSTISSFSASIFPIPSSSSSPYEFSSRSTPSLPPTPPNTPTDSFTAFRPGLVDRDITTRRKRVRFEDDPDDDKTADYEGAHWLDSNQPLSYISSENCWRRIASSLRRLEEDPRTWAPGPGVTAAVDTIQQLVMTRRFEVTHDTTLRAPFDTTWSIRGTALSNTLKVLGERLSPNSHDHPGKTVNTWNGSNSAALRLMATEAREEFNKWMHDTSIVSRWNEGVGDTGNSHGDEHGYTSNRESSLLESSIG